MTKDYLRKIDWEGIQKVEMDILDKQLNDTPKFTKNMYRFCLVYHRYMIDCVLEGIYEWGIDHLPSTWLRMCKAIWLGTFNKDGEAIKRTCKELGIKHTYKAIYAYINIMETE